jgi:putative ABC transport system permease protein
VTNPGFSTDGRLVFDVFLPIGRYRGFDSTTAWYTAVADQLKAVGSVTSVASTSVVPFRPERDVAYYVGVHGEVDDPNRQLTARLRSVSPGFFAAIGVPLVVGREFTVDDRPGPATAIAIVNRAFARRYLQGRDPLKERFYWGFPAVNRGRPFTIVGVVEDVRYVSPGQPAEPTFYMPFNGGPQQTMVVASSLANPRSIAAQVRAAIKKVDPLISVEPQPLHDLVAASLSRQRLGVTLMLLFAGAALLLAAIGIYGVIAYASTQRLGEVATRMALGATPSLVFWMLVNQGRTLSLIGASLGFTAAYASGRLVASRLYEVRASDPTILISAVVVVLAISLIAVLIPARRAAQIDLAKALRFD